MIWFAIGNQWVSRGRSQVLVTPVAGQKIAIIGDSLTYQDGQGEAEIRKNLTDEGWESSNIYVYSCIGKAVDTPDTNGRLTVDDIADARTVLSEEPDIWVIALGTNGATSSDSTNTARINSVMNAIGSASRMVLWVGLAQQTSTSFDHFNALAEPLVNNRTNGLWVDWNGYVKSVRQTGLWQSDGLNMNATGYDWRNKCLALHACPPTDRPSSWWSPAKIFTDFVAPPTGAGFISYTAIPGYSASSSLQTNLNRLTTPAIVTFPEGTFTFFNFAQPGPCGLRLGVNGATNVLGIIGSGRGTVFKMVAGSSTHAGDVPTQSEGRTNPLDLIRFDHIGAGCRFENLMVEGTDQGHYYNGVRFNSCNDVVVSGIYGRGMSPGNADAPPGETFAINFWKCDYATFMDSEIDGRNLAGTPVSASPVGWNGTSSSVHALGARIERVFLHDGVASMPTFWFAKDIHTEDLWVDRTATTGYHGQGINHENADGCIRHHRPNLIIRGFYEAQFNPHLPNCSDNHGLHLSIASSYEDSPNVRVYSPTHDHGPNSVCGALGVMIADNYAGGNQQVTTLPRIWKGALELIPVDANSPGPGTKTAETNFFRYH